MQSNPVSRVNPQVESLLLKFDVFTSSNLLKIECKTHMPMSTTHSLLRSTVAVFGGGRRDRTDDPLLAKQVLSQLGYAPIRPMPSFDGGSGWNRTNDPRLIKTVL